MLAASVPGVLLMVAVAVVLMTFIAWLLPMGLSTTSRESGQDAGSGDTSPGMSPRPASWPGARAPRGLG